jgi:hypothetical protein
MAIKGKGKTKPKRAARAPRHEPVPVKPPFARRGWVKVTATFLAGLLAMSVVWWAWENLDKQQNTKATATSQSLQRDALAAWGKGNLEPTITSVGQLQGGGAPQVATNIGTALDALAKGTDPGVTTDEMTTLADTLEKAADKLNKFALSDTIGGHDFDTAQVDVITTVQTEMVAGLRSLAVAARLTAQIIEDPSLEKALGDTAQAAYDNGQALILRAWNSYTNLSAAAGIPLQPVQGVGAGAGTAPGLGG